MDLEPVRTTTTSPSTTTSTASTTITAISKPYYPSSEPNDLTQVPSVGLSKRGRPTRPTRPPKPSTLDLATYYPPLSIDQPLAEDIGEKVRTTSTTATTTTAISTTETTTTTTTTTTERAIIQTPRPPVHIMPPPRLATTFATPSPSPSQPKAEPRGGCGVPVVNKSCPKGRIVNGTQSCYGQFPWQVNQNCLLKSNCTDINLLNAPKGKVLITVAERELKLASWHVWHCSKRSDEHTLQYFLTGLKYL